MPASFDVEQFEDALLAVPGVVAVHHTHSWSIDGENHVLSTHLVMRAGSSRDDMVEAKCRVRKMVDPHVFEHVTVDVELEGEMCMIGDEHGVSEVAAAKHLHHSH